MEVWGIIIVVFILFVIVDKINTFIQKVNEYEIQKKELDEVKQALNETSTKLARYQILFTEALNNMHSSSVLLPSLIRWSNNLQEYEDEQISNYLRRKKRPARKAAEEVRLAKKEAREYKQEVELARNRVELYERLAPWLMDYAEISLEDMLNSLREEKKIHTELDEQEDPVAKYVPKSEWHKLSISERNQLALERYVAHRKKSLWQIGIDYERYVGYEFEKRGNQVQYHGALNGKSDLGIDLICENEKIVYIVQCKRLSKVKEIPVRENIVAQIYGASELYKMKHNITKEVIPVLVTTYDLSEEAKSFAEYLNVRVLSNYELSDYPMIKCNISNNTGEKIYHLPMDQQYDNVIIGNVEGEFYAKTVDEAESKGFRRAYRWSGNNA